jgi:hypothetical protein
VTATPDDVDREHFAARSFFDISHRIADQLDGIAALLSDCLDLIEQCGLEEALQPHPGRYAVAAGLRDAAARLRVAGAYSSSATAPQPEAGSLHTHDPARPGAVDQALVQNAPGVAHRGYTDSPVPPGHGAHRSGRC